MDVLDEIVMTYDDPLESDVIHFVLDYISIDSSTTKDQRLDESILDEHQCNWYGLNSLECRVDLQEVVSTLMRILNSVEAYDCGLSQSSYEAS